MTSRLAALRSVVAFASLLFTSSAFAQFVRPESGESRQSKLVVFVHGVTGSAATWSNRTTGRSWPKIVAEDRLFRGADIFVYEYPTPYLKPSYDIDGLADRVVTDFAGPQLNFKSYEEIFVVAHSLGGLVIRNAILRADPEFRGKVKGLFLFSSPMDGSIAANLVSGLTRNPQFAGLRKVTRTNSQLRKSWIDLGLNIPSFCAFEVGTFLFEPVVSRESVEPLCNAALVELGLNHIDIVKPESISSDSHRVLQRWYAALNKDLEIDQEENVGDIVVASCSGDKRYHPDTTKRLLKLLSEAGRVRPSYPLPSDWLGPRYTTLLWVKHEPKVVVIHLSCFERAHGGDGEEDRDRDFLKFLETMKDTKVKLVIYSRVFNVNPDWVDKLLAARTSLSAKYPTGRITYVRVHNNEIMFPAGTPASVDLLKAVVAAAR